jgi:hypothetical protein
MDNSSKAVDAALKRLREIEATKPAANGRVRLVFAAMDAKREYLAALRAERKPRAECARCKRRIGSDQPIVWKRWRGHSKPLCLRCDRRQPFPSSPLMSKDDHAKRLAEFDQKPCEVCARPMYLAGYGWSSALRQPLTCSYQCHCRRKVARQTARKKVEPATVACAVCGEMFTQTRRDARTCSGRCRAKLFRQRKKVAA